MVPERMFWRSPSLPIKNNWVIFYSH
jgi:hypothetical protein